MVINTNIMDMYRPAFHFTPPSNWMNDPNGLVYFDGEYHLFYQYHPHSDLWGPMHWGHAVSPDLVHWQHLPIALHPDENGRIFSGGAVVDEHNTAGFGKNALVVIFTYDRDQKESQNLAYSTDRGRTWTKYAGNPVIPPPNPPRDFRDPQVIWYEDHWVMALAVGDTIYFYTSPDLKHWEHSGRFGGGEYGSTIGVWETPDLFKLEVNSSTETRWMLLVGVTDGGLVGGSGTQYFIGDFDGKTFTSENPPETILWADHGSDYYAPQTWNDEPYGRCIALAWMSNWQYAKKVPSQGWRGVSTLPREIKLVNTEHGLRLAQLPVHELETLRGEHFHWQDKTLTPTQNLLDGIEGDSLEILAEVQLNPRAEMVGFRLRIGENEETVLTFSIQTQRLILDRGRSGKVDFDDTFASPHGVKLYLRDDLLRLRIILDRCSIEVFADDGRVTLSNLIFPSASSRGLDLFVKGGEMKLNHLDLYRLNPAIVR